MGLSYILLYYRHNIKIVKTKQNKMPKGSGLTKPLNLSTELADLVGAKKGEKLSRPEVVKRLWAHIKTNKLQDPRTSSTSFPTPRCSPSSERRRSVPSGWPSSSRPTQTPKSSQVKVSREEEYLDDNQKF